MKQTVIVTVEATDVVDVPEITADDVEKYKADLALYLNDLGIGEDDLHIKVQVFQHEGDDER